ncbi:MAG: metal ABC transporter permease [Fuerstiella sp.]|nr:metal ABC transporter permease [Fuerstiella sp.]
MTVFTQTSLVLIGTVLLGVTAGLVGTFAYLRRRALAGDVIAHAALPGLCMAFLLTQSRSITVLLIGALITGVAGAFLMSFLRRVSRLREDAILGTVLSVSYGLGIALTRTIQNNYRNERGADLESFIIGRAATMLTGDVLQIAVVAAGCSIVVLVVFKELKLLSFDESFCRVQGWPATGLDLLLMFLTAVTVIVGLPAVGVVLTAALLIIPAAAARYWTDRLSYMMTVSAGIGGVSGATGTLLSANMAEMPTGPLVVLTSATLFIISWMFAPRRGWLWNRRISEEEVAAAAEELLTAESGNRTEVSP